MRDVEVLVIVFLRVVLVMLRLNRHDAASSLVLTTPS
jgi:hypothetical protein